MKKEQAWNDFRKKWKIKDKHMVQKFFTGHAMMKCFFEGYDCGGKSNEN